MFWLIFVGVAVAAQKDSSILEKIAYAVESPTLTENIVATGNTTIIRLSTQDFNITQVISPNNQSENEALTLLALADPDDNALDNDDVTENMGFLPTEVYRHEKDDIKTTITNLEFYPKVSKKNILPIDTTSRTVEEDTIPYDSSTMIVPIEKDTKPESLFIATTPNLPEAQKLVETKTEPSDSSDTSNDVSDEATTVETTTICEPSETTVSYEVTSAEPTTTYQPRETTLDSITLTTTEKPTSFYKSLTPATPTIETTPMAQPEVPSTTSKPVTGKPKPSPSSEKLATTFDSAKSVDIPASVDVVEPTTINDLNVVTPAKPEVEKMATTTTGPVPVISKPSTQAFYVSNGHGFTRYPYLQVEDYRSSIIFEMMSRFRMPQIYINTKPYVIKVPQAKIVET